MIFHSCVKLPEGNRNASISTDVRWLFCWYALRCGFEHPIWRFIQPWWNNHGNVYDVVVWIGFQSWGKMINHQIQWVDWKKEGSSWMDLGWLGRFDHGNWINVLGRQHVPKKLELWNRDSLSDIYLLWIMAVTNIWFLGDFPTKPVYISREIPIAIWKID